MGKGSTAVQNKLIKDDLDKRLEKLIKEKKINVNVFTTKKMVIYFLFTIGSESERDNTYDILLEFNPDAILESMALSLANYDLRFFSNCPSFVYTFANTFYKKDLLISGTEKLYSSIVLNQEAEIKNPNNIVNFEKSIYFACKYLELNPEMLLKPFLGLKAQMLSKEAIIYKLRKFSTIDIEITKENQRLQKEKEEKKKSKESIRKSYNPGEDYKRSVNAITGTKIGRISPKEKIKPKKKNSTIRKI